jgi:Calcineurin-like phosphoesterase
MIRTHRRILALTLALCATGAMLATDATAVGAGPAVTGSPEAIHAKVVPTIVGAVGDIACDRNPGSNPRSCQYDDVATRAKQVGMDAFLALGDQQYQNGEYENYVKYYDQYFGALKSITYPVPGNHEDTDPSGAFSGYFQYFGAVAGPPNGYYSFDLGKWHMIALNSELCYSGPPACNSQSDQYQWLAADLAAHPNSAYKCTLAYWHRPSFSFVNSTDNGPAGALKPLWTLLAAAGADVVLNGHIHNYERWAPMDPDGNADPSGIREFVVGTGGDDFASLGDTSGKPSTLQAAQSSAFGLLKLSLRPHRYQYRWLSAVHQPKFTDRGKGTCH